MWLGALICVAVVLIGVVVGLAIGSKYRKLYNKGVALKRPYDFHKQEYTFKTIVPGIDNMLSALNLNVLAQQNISVNRETNAERVIFGNPAGSFTAFIQAENSGQEGVYCYRFRIHSWTSHKGTILNSARMGINVVLTALEKAFLTLDYNAVEERVYMTDIKTRASFFE